MIELTQQSLLALQDYSGHNILSNWIITKQHIPSDGKIGMLETCIDEVIVGKCSEMYYTNIFNNDRLATMHYGGVEENNGYYKVIKQILLNQDCYVIYIADAGTTSAKTCDKLFNDLPNLISVDYVGNAIKSITFGGDYASLTEIDLSGNPGNPGNIYTDLKITDNKTFIYNGNHNNVTFAAGCFSGSPIKKMVFPDAATSYTIPANCCSNCIALEEVVIPDCITSIGADAFKNCSNLKYIHIGRQVTTIGNGAFDGCIYPDLYFDVDLQNTKFYGEHGCLIRKPSSENNGKYSLIHGTKTFIEDYQVNSYNGSYYDLASNLYINRVVQKPGNGGNIYNFIIPGVWVNSPSWTGATVQVKTINDETVNVVLVTLDNLSEIQRLTAGVTTDATIYCSMYQVVNQFENNACIGDVNIEDAIFYKVGGSIDNYQRDYVWYMLHALGDNAFKGCTNIQHFKFLRRYDEHLIAYEDAVLGSSVFENCSSLITVESGQTLGFSGSKTFFNCTALTSVTLNEFYFVSETSLWFGNTPNLNTIQHFNAPTLADYRRPEGRTALIPYTSYDGHGQSMNVILTPITENSVEKWCVGVGCKGTMDLSTVIRPYLDIIPEGETVSIGTNIINDYAFYGSSLLTSVNLGEYKKVGKSSFYACSRLTTITGIDRVQYIDSNAFFGCSGLTTFNSTNAITIGNKAFANSGLTRVNLPFSLTTIAEDAFDGCNLQTFTSNGENPASIVRPSHDTVANSFLISSTLSGGATNANINKKLIKSANGYRIGNTVYSSESDGEIKITEIKSEAFKNVNLNHGYPSNSTIHIDSIVTKVGSNIYAQSKLNNSPTTTGTLSLDGSNDFPRENGYIMNSSDYQRSYGLLIRLGAKYFKNVVNNTLANRTNYHYYEIRKMSTTNTVIGIKLVEIIQNQATDVLHIAYDNSGNIQLLMINKLNLGYKNADTESHLVQLTSPINMILMYNNQRFTPREVSVYCDSDLIQGTTWLGLNRDDFNGQIIPNDIAIGPYNNPTLTGDSDAFANAKWISTVNCQRAIGGVNGIKNAFKNCTNLSSFKYDITSHAFEGAVTEGMFEGCTNFALIGPITTNSLIAYPVSFGANAFSKTGLNNDSSRILDYGVDFGKDSFNGTNITEINFKSALNINPEAFKNCNLETLRADNTGGVYFELDNSIVDTDIKIILGTRTSNFIPTTAIGDYAFYGRKYTSTWNVAITKNNYNVGKSAFSESSINTYSINGAGNSIGKEAFKKCINLTTVSITGSSCTIDENAFEGCTSLTSLTLPPANNTDISKSAFEGCSNLPSVTLGALVDENAFKGCTNLTTLDLNNKNSLYIENTAFIGCHIASIITNQFESANYYINDEGVYIKDNDNHHIELLLGTNQFSWPIIHDDSTQGKEQALRSVRVIGKNAFNGRGVSGPVNIQSGITKIDDYAFANNPGITELTIPPTVEYIGAHAFDGCTNIDYIVLPDSCKFVGESAFKGCRLSKGFNCNTKDERYFTNEGTITPTSLSRTTDTLTPFNGSLDLTGNNVFDNINKSAFMGTNIKSIKLNNECTNIGENAFNSCLNLTELHINSRDIIIDDGAFYGCANLADIYIHETCNITSNDGLYEVGSYVPEVNRRLHLVQGQDTTKGFIQSLTQNNKFEIVYDA